MMTRSRLELAQRRKLTREDIMRVVELAHRSPLEMGHVLLAVRPLCFRVDGVEVLHPVGMECGRLELDVEITAGEKPR